MWQADPEGVKILDVRWGASPETFDYEFEEGGWTDDGQGQLECDVRQVYRLKETGDFAYERTRRVQLTLRQAGSAATS